MKRLFLPLLASLALPTAVIAEQANVYLLGRTKNISYTIPMQTFEICEAAGQKFINKELWNQGGKPVPSVLLTYLCVKAK